MTQQYDLFTHYTNSSKMKFNDHKTIHWLIYEIGYLNDAILRGDIIHFKNARKLAEKKLEQAKRDLAKDGITVNSVTPGMIGTALRPFSAKVR